MKKILFLLTLLSSTTLFAQDDLIDALLEEQKPEKEFAAAAFKGTRVINSQSIENLGAGVLDYRILHRFGSVLGGAQDFFGLDQASMRMSFDYGITKRLMIGIGRSGYLKEFDGNIKYKVIWQHKGKNPSPITIVLNTGTILQSIAFADPTRKNLFSSRLGYFYTAAIGRKFNESFSLQVTPTLVHRNLVATTLEPNDLYVMGIGGRLKLNKRLALVADYQYLVNNTFYTDFNHPLALGIDIETGGHVFQLHFSNTTGMNERAILLGQNGSWAKGDIRFGFNLSRVFDLKKRI